MDVPGDRVTRTTLARESCLALLRDAAYARVVISLRCLPAALPAHINVIGDHRLVLTSTEDAVLAAARRGDVLSVQIDGLEPDGATWSVMASGIAGVASSDEALTAPLRAAVAGGATLIALPLSVLVGERVG